MSGMVERVARALIQQIGSPWPYDKMDPAIKALWHSHARAAIEAMRKPTAVMLDAPSKIMGGGFQNSHSDVEAWEAMIGAALKD